MTDFGKILDLETSSSELPARDVWAAWVIVVAFVTAMLLVGWIFSPPRKFLESCRGLVE